MQSSLHWEHTLRLRCPKCRVSCCCCKRGSCAAWAAGPLFAGTPGWAVTGWQWPRVLQRAGLASQEVAAFWALLLPSAALATAVFWKTLAAGNIPGNSRLSGACTEFLRSGAFSYALPMPPLPSLSWHFVALLFHSIFIDFIISFYLFHHVAYIQFLYPILSREWNAPYISGSGRLGEWADRNLTKFNRGKCKALHLGRKEPLQQYWGLPGWGAQGVFVGPSWAWALAAKEEQQDLGCVARSTVSGSREMIVPLYPPALLRPHL